jgi:hypothetical protein
MVGFNSGEFTMDVNEDAVVDFQRFFIKVSHLLFYVQISPTPAGSRPKD